ncbi:MAG: MFS transporter [Gammaproteobacteria bacterium]
MSWVPLVYLLASAMFVLPCGRIAEVITAVHVCFAGTAGVLVSSVLAAATQTGTQLLAMRFAQGVFTAALYATQIAIVSAAFPSARRGQAIGLTHLQRLFGIDSRTSAGADGCKNKSMARLPVGASAVFVDSAVMGLAAYQ